MTLRSKLLLAQAPLIAGLILIGVLGSVTTTSLGRGAQTILKDNYRSVLAAQRMKDSLERIDSAAFFVVAGEVDEVFVRFLPEGQELTDFGHGDLLFSPDALAAWDEIVGWIETH